MRKIYLFIVLLLHVFSAIAQKNTILEQVRTFSMHGPVMTYFSLPDTRSVFIKQLNDQLLSKKNARISDTSLRIIALDNINHNNTSNFYFTLADTNTLHLYIDIYEYEPNTFFFSQPHYLQDSLLFKRAKSVFTLAAMLVNHQKKIITNDVLTICVSQGNSNGFGLMPRNISLTPKGFTDMLNLGIGYLLDSTNNTEIMEVKAPPAFYADDFILPKINQYPVLQTKAQKNIFSYPLNAGLEMIRLGDTFYEELIVKGKKRNVTEHSSLAKSINETGNQNRSDFVQLRQECRDVLRDKNYTLKLVTEINPDFNFVSTADVFTQFLPGDIHVLLKDSDTIARFSIHKNIGIAEKKIFLNKISNGYDSSSVVTIGTPSVSKNVFYEYQIKGVLENVPFIIRCADRNNLKEIIYNEKEVALAKGLYLPERISIFDASLTPEKLNQLLMIAFSKFYQ